MYFALKYKLNETWNRIVIFDEISKLTSFIHSIEYLRFNGISPVVSCDVSAHLLGRDLVCRCPHVDLLVGVHAGDDEEHAGAPGSPWQQPAQPEDDGALVFLDKGHFRLKAVKMMAHIKLCKWAGHEQIEIVKQ